MNLLVSTMKIERVGYLDSSFVLPYVGNDAYGYVPQGELVLPLKGTHLLLLFFIFYFLYLYKVNQ